MEHMNVTWWSNFDTAQRYGVVVGFVDNYAAWVRQKFKMDSGWVWDDKYTRVLVEDLVIVEGE